MKFSTFATVAGAALMTVSPIVGHAAPVRAAAPVSEESSIGGGEWANALIIIAIAAAGMLALILSDDEDSPVSP